MTLTQFLGLFKLRCSEQKKINVNVKKFRIVISHISLEGEKKVKIHSEIKQSSLTHKNQKVYVYEFLKNDIFSNLVIVLGQ